MGRRDRIRAFQALLLGDTIVGAHSYDSTRGAERLVSRPEL